MTDTIVWIVNPLPLLGTKSTQTLERNLNVALPARPKVKRPSTKRIVKSTPEMVNMISATSKRSTTELMENCSQTPISEDATTRMKLDRKLSSPETSRSVFYDDRPSSHFDMSLYVMSTEDLLAMKQERGTDALCEEQPKQVKTSRQRRKSSDSSLDIGSLDISLDGKSQVSQGGYSRRLERAMSLQAAMPMQPSLSKPHSSSSRPKKLKRRESLGGKEGERISATKIRSSTQQEHAPKVIPNRRRASSSETPSSGRGKKERSHRRSVSVDYDIQVALDALHAEQPQVEASKRRPRTPRMFGSKRHPGVSRAFSFRRGDGRRTTSCTHEDKLTDRSEPLSSYGYGAYSYEDKLSSQSEREPRSRYRKSFSKSDEEGEVGDFEREELQIRSLSSRNVMADEFKQERRSLTKKPRRRASTNSTPASPVQAPVRSVQCMQLTLMGEAVETKVARVKTPKILTVLPNAERSPVTSVQLFQLSFNGDAIETKQSLISPLTPTK